MDLINILISGVGSGIAKGILNIWLEEEPIRREISKNIVSIVATKTTNVIAQKNITRQFDELSDNVAQNILKLFNTNGNTLSKDEKEKVAELAGVAVNNLNLSSKLLVVNDLNPKVIESLLLKNSYTPNEESDLLQFTKEQTDLYKIVLSDSAQLIVDIASELPSFTENSIAEILTRQSFIAETGREILKEVEQIRESINSGIVRTDQFETDYRRQIVRKLDQLQLFGVDVAYSSKRYKLSVAYVSLMVESKVAGDEKLLTIENCLKINNKLIIKGLAGSGKTTLLQWIAIKSAGHKMSKELNDWNSCIPFFIRLREFSDKDLPTPNNFVNGISTVYGEAMPSDWVREKLITGRAIILIDGIDEIESSKREEIKEWILEIDILYPNNKLIVTSRPYAVQENWMGEIGFLDVDLQEMNLSDIDSFIEHWHEAAIDVEKDRDEKSLIKDLEPKIKLELRHNKNLLKLSTNPLLCALICALNRQRLSKLPNDRIELYEACIGMFFRRDVERKVSLVDYHDIGTKPKELILSDLAYWLIRNGWSEADKQAVAQRVSRKLDVLHGLPQDVTGDGVVRYFVERSGVLRYPIENKIDFPHRTFEEYFAAKAIVAEGDYGLLLSNIKDDQWREVIILTCGLARKNEATNIINEILKEGDISTDFKEYYHLLAAICAEMVIELSPDTRLQVEKRFKVLIPPKTVSKANEISKLGELAIPYLSYKRSKHLSVSRLKPIMRTLAIIGDEALPMLKEYSNDTRLGIKQELIEGGKYSKDPIQYGKVVLSQFTRIKMIGYFSLDLFTHVNNIKELNLDVDSNKSKNIEILGSLRKLELLVLRYWRRKPLDLSPLNNCRSISYLGLYNMKIADISAVKELPNLHTLLLHGTKISDLNILTSFSNLKNLGIDEEHLIESLDFLLKMEKLETIFIQPFDGRYDGRISKSIVSEIKKKKPHIKIKHFKVLLHDVYY